jgi:membrane-associated protein
MFFDIMLVLLQSLHGLPVYAMVFAVLLLSGIGAPWGQDAMLLAVASFAMQRGMDPVALTLAAWVAIVAGDALSVFLGHRYGTRWVRRPWAASFVPRQDLPALEARTRQVGPWLSFVTRFLPGQRGTIFFLAGTLRLPWRAFFIGNGLAAAVQVPLYVVGVRSLGWRWQDLRSPFEWADNLLTIALLGVLLAAWLRVRRRRGVA